MSTLSKDILASNRNFYENYRGATVLHNNKLVMKEGVVIDNKWYVHKVGCFLIDRLKKRRKRGGDTI